MIQQTTQQILDLAVIWGQHRRRWTNNTAALAQRSVFSGKTMSQAEPLLQQGSHRYPEMKFHDFFMTFHDHFLGIP